MASPLYLYSIVRPIPFNDEISSFYHKLHYMLDKMDVRFSGPTKMLF